MSYNKDWFGPYNVRVKNYIPYVPDKDGINIVSIINGTLTRITNIKNTINLTRDEYLNEYCYLEEGIYYYNVSSKNRHNIEMYCERDEDECCIVF